MVYAALFKEQGACFLQEDGVIRQHGALKGGKLVIRGDVSSQFITGLLFTLPLLDGDSVIEILPPFESRSYVLLTLQVLREFGITAHFAGPYTLAVKGNQRYRSAVYTVEGDYSQLAFFAVRGAVGAETECRGVRLDSAQGDRVICELVKKAGAKIQAQTDAVTFSPGRLHGSEIDLADCPDLGPALTVLPLSARGKPIL